MQWWYATGRGNCKYTSISPATKNNGVFFPHLVVKRTFPHRKLLDHHYFLSIARLFQQELYRTFWSIFRLSSHHKVLCKWCQTLHESTWHLIYISHKFHVAWYTQCKTAGRENINKGIVLVTWFDIIISITIQQYECGWPVYMNFFQCSVHRFYNLEAYCTLYRNVCTNITVHSITAMEPLLGKCMYPIMKVN